MNGLGNCGRKHTLLTLVDSYAEHTNGQTRAAKSSEHLEVAAGVKGVLPALPPGQGRGSPAPGGGRLPAPTPPPPALAQRGPWGGPLGMATASDPGDPPARASCSPAAAGAQRPRHGTHYGRGGPGGLRRGAGAQAASAWRQV